MRTDAADSATGLPQRRPATPPGPENAGTQRRSQSGEDAARRSTATGFPTTGSLRIIPPADPDRDTSGDLPVIRPTDPTLVRPDEFQFTPLAGNSAYPAEDESAHGEYIEPPSAYPLHEPDNYSAYPATDNDPTRRIDTPAGPNDLYSQPESNNPGSEDHYGRPENTFPGSDDAYPRTKAYRDPEDAHPRTEAYSDPDDAHPRTKAYSDTEDADPRTKAYREPEDTYPRTEAYRGPDDTYPGTKAYSDTDDTYPRTEAYSDLEDTYARTKAAFPRSNDPYADDPYAGTAADRPERDDPYPVTAADRPGAGDAYGRTESDYPGADGNYAYPEADDPYARTEATYARPGDNYPDAYAHSAYTRSDANYRDPDDDYRHPQAYGDEYEEYDYAFGAHPGYDRAAPEHDDGYGGSRRRSIVLPIVLCVLAVAFAAVAAVVGWRFVSKPGSTGPSVASGPADSNVSVSQPPPSAAPSSGTSATTTTAAVPAGATECPGATRAQGKYTKSATGTSVTSCAFAEAVRAAYAEEAGSGSGTPTSVVAVSPVTGRSYTMDCSSSGRIITCTGGENAVVYVY